MNSFKNALTIFNHAVAAVNPSVLIHNHVHLNKQDLTISGNVIRLTANKKIFIIGAGKASAVMAHTLHDILGETITAGIVVTKYGHGLPLKSIKQMEAAHPVPDEQSVHATEQIVKLVTPLTADDIVIFLLSGGASSLLADFPPGSNLEEVQALYDLLLKSGATIHEMNTVRKHTSQVKGGQLAKKTFPAELYSLILSDVTGDDMDVIGSGPTVANKSTFADSLAVLTKYDLADKIPAPLYEHIIKGCEGKISDTPKQGDAIFANTHNLIIGSNLIALQAAANKASALGYQPHIITHTLKGEARATGKMLAEKAIAYNGSVPACLLYGGESTVNVKGKGLGGRNMELALAAGIAITSAPNITILSAGTDGTDGPTDATGAIVNAGIMKTALSKQLDATSYLNNNDSYNFFSQTNGLIKTGPTQTNVMDIMLALVD